MKKNKILLSIRKKKKMTQCQFASWLGIPYKTYKAYECYDRIPRYETAKKIIEKLKPFGVVSPVVFLPVDAEKTYSEIIAKHMSSETKEFSSIHVISILKAIKIESRDRPSYIDDNSEKGQEIINERIAQKANQLIGINTITGHDVRLLKQCQSNLQKI